MYSSKSWWQIKLAVKAPDNDLWPLLYVFGGPLWLFSWLKVCFVLWFHSGVRLWSVENACSIQVLSSGGAGFCSWCFCECQIWGGGERGGGVRSRKGSGIVFPCLKQNNLCVIISMLIVCWGSVIPRSGLRVFCVGWGKDVDEETSSSVCASAAVCRDYRNIWVIDSRKISQWD